MNSPYPGVEFWESRHRDIGGLRSGGHQSFSEHVNYRFYVTRLATLIDIIGDRGSSEVPLRVLDAGCGRGWFLAQLRAMGHAVDGFDPSGDALATARDIASDARLEQAAIVHYDAPRTYDVVYAIDVLIHVVDDAEWEASVRRLASLTGSTGRLVITDIARVGIEEPFSPAEYLRYRPQSWYQRVLSEHGMRHVSSRPYDFRETRGGFHVYENFGVGP